MASRRDRLHSVIVVESKKTCPHWRALSLCINLRRRFDHEDGFIQRWPIGHDMYGAEKEM